ncbi:MAG: VCBS repeat-containing protein [Kiritimatiellaeota bacterium]|nr:VCBS repeat-containing protein [Kiritimatiellota bacterium]
MKAMKRVMGFILAGMLTALAYEPVICASQVFWVAPTGSDTNPGTIGAPFQSLMRARDAVRSVDPLYCEDIVVNLFDGTYRLTDKLELDERDSGHGRNSVIWRAVPGEKPVICGSLKVEGWQRLSGIKNIYYADVEPGTRSRQLFVNGQRATRARTTDYPASFLPNKDEGIQYEVTLWNYDDNWAWADPAQWHNPGEVEAVLITQWKMMICGVDSVQVTGAYSGRLVMEMPAWTNANCFYGVDLAKPGIYGPGIWSFWQVTRFENSLSFLDLPGEWVLDSAAGRVYYMPRPDEDMATADIELPVVEALIAGAGAPGSPVSNIRFEGLTFRYATWLRPSGDEGYVADQSGMYLVGNNLPNLIGHIQPNTPGSPDRLDRTPGNLRFSYAQNIVFQGNVFEHLGSVALDFDTGSQSNLIQNNCFDDISSSAIQIGGVSEIDHHPPTPDQLTCDNTVFNNLIQNTGRDYFDSAAIFVGCTTRTTIRNNTITNVPWSGIALGWGWGLLDPGSYPGVPGAISGQWGSYGTPTAICGNKIINNRIEQFLQVLWDGGAIYTTGFQGNSATNGTLISGNVAIGKRPKAGGNTFYTDGGSRYVTLINNVSFDNPIGEIDFGPPPNLLAPLPYSILPSLANGWPYGKDIGGCRTFGDINYIGNYWLHDEFFNISPYTDPCGISHPTRLIYLNNHIINSLADVPASILRNAGFPAPVPGDYDGDGKADVSIYRGSDGLWLVALSGYDYQRGLVVETGLAGWTPVPGDYDGDGITDVAAYNHLSGLWLIKFSSSGLVGEGWLGGPTFTVAQGDFDGDARTDPAVYREADGYWLVSASSRQYALCPASLGETDYQAVVADYDGDGLADPAVYNRENGLWAISLSGRGYQPLVTGTFGGSGYLPATADYDGDGLADPAIYAPDTAYWQVLFSGSLATQGYYTWGDAVLATIGGVPVPADYDADGKADLAVYHQDTGLWELYLSTQDYQLAWGLFGGPEYQPVKE